MRAVVYSKDNCPYCVKAKALLSRNKYSYEEVVVGKDILREEFLTQFPDQRTVPLVFVEGEKVGGYDQLVEWFDNRKQFLVG
jgi:glutaredoxin